MKNQKPNQTQNPNEFNKQILIDEILANWSSILLLKLNMLSARFNDLINHTKLKELLKSLTYKQLESFYFLILFTKKRAEVDDV